MRFIWDSKTPYNSTAAGWKIDLIPLMQLNYKQLGEGPALIIMHGLFGSLDNWATLAKELATDYSVWLLDLPNHGRSPHTDEFNYRHMAGTVMDFIEEHGIENPVILGHSMGGKVVMQMVFENEQDFAGAIVVDIAPKAYPVHHDEIISALQAVPVADISSRGEAEEVLAGRIPEADVRLFLMKNLARQSDGSYNWKMNLSVIADKIEQVGTPMPEGQVIDLRTLFIRGGDSNYILDADEADIARRFNHYSLETVAHAGHWVHAQQPQVLLDLVKKFMETEA